LIEAKRSGINRHPGIPFRHGAGCPSDGKSHHYKQASLEIVTNQEKRKEFLKKVESPPASAGRGSTEAVVFFSF
jgi:hypothetical protein